MKFFVLFWLILIPNFVFSATKIQNLYQDYTSGKIDYRQYLIHSIHSLHQCDAMGQAYHAEDYQYEKCGTGIMLQTFSHLDELPPLEKTRIQSYFVRPKLSRTYISASGLFKIHYADSGNSTVDPMDENKNNLPDYVEQAAITLDYSYKLIIDTLGYNKPPTDGGEDGPEYDLYFVNIGAYGQTTPENLISRNPVSYSSYMEINNRFGSGFVTKGIDAVKVTCAHEFFHMVQLGYIYREKDLFFFEMSSTWMEDVAYDGINDYFSYLRAFFRDSSVPFYTFNGTHEYGTCIWHHMIEKKYGRDVIKAIWEFLPRYEVLQAMDYALINKGSSLKQEMESFSIWNFFTGRRNDPVTYYPEGAFYPELDFRKTQSFQNDVSLVDSIPSLSTAYYYFQDAENDRNFALALANVSSTADQNTIKTPYQLNVLSNPINNKQLPIDKNLYIQLTSADLEVWRGNAIILYSGTRKIESFSSVKSTTLPEVRLYPNPFIVGQDPELKIEFKLEKREWVELSILSMHGQVIRKIKIPGILPGFLESGFHPEGEWDGKNDAGDYVGSGVYLACIKAESFVKYQKFSLIRK
ncbi:hypothetical protein JW964_22190 [candidate division KSB1 bacterium]|nr:hypothetical protein [candidate division KSB1 bacterium]